MPLGRPHSKDYPEKYKNSFELYQLTQPPVPAGSPMADQVAAYLEWAIIQQQDGFEKGEIINIGALAEGSVDIMQFGAVLQGDYRMLDDKLILGLELGFASGDNSPGMGVRPFAEKQFSYAHGDTNINNFRFNLDYHVDMILWREIVGTVTDAFYLKPSVRYDVAEGFGAKLSAVYSSAIYSDSTRGKSHPLGLEFNLDIFYFSDDNFHAGIAYGLLIPFNGMDDLGDDMARGGIGEANQDDGGNIAHRILGRLVLYF